MVHLVVCNEKWWYRQETTRRGEIMVSTEYTKGRSEGGGRAVVLGSVYDGASIIGVLVGVEGVVAMLL